MDSAASLWISEMGLDNSVFADQDDFMDSLDEELVAILRQDLETCLSPGNNSSSSSTLINNIPSTNSITSLSTSPCMDSPPFACEPPAKIQKPNNFTDFSTIHNLPNPASAPIILSFGNENSAENLQQAKSRPLNADEEAAVSELLNPPANSEEPAKRQQPVKKGRVRPPSQTYDHIIAERKRREQLSQRFVALSTIVPGLKKMDKTSVLGDAIKYLKHLQERVKMLEEQAMKQTVESVVLVRKSHIMVEDGGSSVEESGSSDEQPLPEIEARVCNNHILLRIQCERQKGVFVNLLSKVESLKMEVINTNVTPFGNLALDITIIAEMEKDFSLTVKEVVKRLRAALRPTA